jgi:hypothetical protein
MFGEYCVYCDEMMVALVCDDRFYLKPTAAVESLDVELEPCPPSWRWLPPICGDCVFPRSGGSPPAPLYLRRTSDPGCLDSEFVHAVEKSGGVRVR